MQFLSGYSIFQGSVVSIMLVDYFLVRRGNMNLPDLFRKSPSGRYYFTKGFNIRALAAFIAGFLLPLPGFVASFGYDISTAATNMFSLGWALSFAVGGVSYWVICLVFKVPGDDGECGFEEKVDEAEGMILRGGMEYKNGDGDGDGYVGDNEKPQEFQKERASSQPSEAVV